MQIALKCALPSGRMKMGERIVDMQEAFPNKEDSPDNFLKNIGLGEDNGLVISATKLKRILEKIRQEQLLTSDIKKLRTNQRCIEESYLQNNCSREFKNPKCTSFVSLHENPGEQCVDLVEVRASDSLSPVFKTATAFNIPASKREILFDSSRTRRRRTKSSSDLGRFVIGCTSATGPGDVIIHPVGQWIFNTIERSKKARSLFKSPLFSHLGATNSDMSLGRRMSVHIKNMKSTELVNSPSGLQIRPLQKPLSEAKSPQRQRSGSVGSDRMLVSCSSTNSTLSYESTSSTCEPASKGFLHCTWKSGMPYFVFSVDDRGDVYVANAWKVESSGCKASDYIYSFHYKTDGKIDQKERGISGDYFSDLVGKMKVSSSLTLSSDNLKPMETEFILFGCSEDHIGDVHSSTPNFRKNKGLPKKVLDIFKTDYLMKHKSTPKYGGPRHKNEDILQEPSLDMLGKLDELDKKNIIRNNLLPNHELAAIVVKDHQQINSQDVEEGGWGLKFLEKVANKHQNTCLTFPSENCGESCLRNKKESLDVNVLIPAALHGGPRTKNGGPSSLTERWRSHGHCDCGGWDIGCPLTVLHNSSSNQNILCQVDEQEDGKSFDLFSEGSKQGVPTLKMVNIHEGLYYVHFKSTLSALQSFSIAVALIHAQSPTLYPKMYGS